MKHLRRFIVILLMLTASVCYAGSWSGEELFLSESPPVNYKGGHRHAGGEHSEHAGTPMKSVYLNTHDVSDNAEVYILRADGSLINGSLKRGEEGISITFDTKPDYTMDGIFNVYVVDKKVVDDVLIARAAKMNVINHSCGWGHKYKYDSARSEPKHLSTIPLEIKGYGFWSNNFHRQTMSGDTLEFTVLNNGMPVKNAKVKVRMQTGWMKHFKTDDEGNFLVQLIRDYYPEKWSVFNKRQRGTFLVTAEYESEERGIFNGIPYNRIKMTATLPWKYQPQRKEYTSYLYGMLIVVSAFIFTVGLVYFYRERRRKTYEEMTFNEK